MIAGSVANDVGLSARQLQLIPFENCADCRFARFRLQAATSSILFFLQNTIFFLCMKSQELQCIPLNIVVRGELWQLLIFQTVYMRD
jgi:hypothetical protein